MRDALPPRTLFYDDIFPIASWLKKHAFQKAAIEQHRRKSFFSLCCQVGLSSILTGFDFMQFACLPHLNDDTKYLILMPLWRLLEEDLLLLFISLALDLAELQITATQN